jgi:alkylresorcinol/alkylpyrone synthase
MPNPRILSVATAHPPHRWTQEQLLALSPYKDELRRGFFLRSGIEGRYLAIDPATFRPDETVDQLQERFRTASVDLGRRALEAALERAGLAAGDLDFLATTTCTGRLCPSLDARLIRELRPRPNIQRVHVGDTGCSSAIVALQQAWNHLRAFPGHRAAVVAIEVSSTGYFVDDDPETAVANALFADGAGALVLGPGSSGPEVVEHRTLIRPEHLDIMGFTFPGGRQRILLSKDVRTVASSMMAELIGEFLEAHSLARGDVRHWILHSAGRRVLENAQAALGLADADLEPTRTVLRRFGNMSSATVLFVLEEVLRAREPGPGDLGLMVALGPGFAAEGALLRW